MLGRITRAGPSAYRSLSLLRSAVSNAKSFGRNLTASAIRNDLEAEIDKRINQREIIEQKRKAFEEKYGDLLQRKMQAEGVSDLDTLKKKVMAPSVKAALKAQKARERIAEAPDETNAPSIPTQTQAQTPTAAKTDGRKEQAEGDRSGIKPLSSILNLPLIHLTPHDANAISKIWTAYHTTHSTLSSSFLSASLPTNIYSSMLSLAQANPIFVLPLPRDASPSPSTDTPENPTGVVKTDEYEMFYLQWLFHPTPKDPSGKSLPPTTSIIFTPLEEFKQAGEWANPYLVLTHYPGLSASHDVVLMRGEISSEVAGKTNGSDINPGWLLSQQQAQLLALALQRFYCAGIAPPNESVNAQGERKKRADALVGFRERPEEWDWKGLVEMAYGGMV